MKILTFNVGSSSLKCALYQIEQRQPELLLKLHISNLNTPQARLELVAVESEQQVELGQSSLEQAAVTVWQQLERLGQLPDKVVHRIVHGGELFFSATRVDAKVVAALESLSALAPLHQPPALAVIKTLQQQYAEIEHWACFDTGFHQGMTEHKCLYALPEHIRVQGVRRYGFHGLSYQHVYHKLCQQDARQFDKRVVIAHLGSGVSCCAIHRGQSQDFSMGFSALEGPMMSTRAGRLDAGVILWLLEQGYQAAELPTLLYKESGWAAVSAQGSDMRQLLERSNDSNCQLAIDSFVFQVSKEISALLPSLGGLDTLVFTGGIGENLPVIRQQIAEQFAWQGAIISDEKNLQQQSCFSSSASKVGLWQIPCDESLSMVMQVI